MTAERFRAYTERERLTLPGSTAAGDEATTAILGDADDVAGQLRALEARLPIDLVPVRAQWPGMGPDDVRAYLDELGSAVVHPLAKNT